MNSLSIEPLIYDKAWLIAEKASKILQEKYHVKEVFVFGSLLDINNFRSCSDIDLAVRGLPENKYYLALNDLLDLQPKTATAGENRDVVIEKLAKDVLSRVPQPLPLAAVMEKYPVMYEQVKLKDLNKTFSFQLIIFSQ